MLRKIIIILICGALLGAIWLLTPISNGYYQNKGISEYNSGQYNEAVKNLERVLFFDKTNKNARFFYVRALSKLEPTLSVQKKLYEISKADINDESKIFAKSQVNILRKKFLEGVEDNYIYNAISGKNILRWDINTFPLKVYFENVSEVPAYYVENIKKALNQWQQRTNFIKFTVVSNPADAQIFIKFKDIEAECDENAGCRFTLAYTEPVVVNQNRLKAMNLTFHKTDPFGQQFSALEIYNTAIHELGHTLGIMGHSENSDDIMYSNNDRTSDMYSQYRSELQYISLRDLKTLALLYRLSPTVMNTDNRDDEKFYYSALILGDDSELYRKKLTELERYIKDYPNIPTGYINISSVYADMGEFDKAISALNFAQMVATSDSDKYLILYNKTIIYANSGDYKTALTYAQQAKSLNDNKDINEIIAELQKELK